VISLRFAPPLVFALLLASPLAGCATAGTGRPVDGTLPAVASPHARDVSSSAEPREAPEHPTREVAAREPREVREPHMVVDRERYCARCR
jgi:hypothetical protein